MTLDSASEMPTAKSWLAFFLPALEDDFTCVRIIDQRHTTGWVLLQEFLMFHTAFSISKIKIGGRVRQPKLFEKVRDDYGYGWVMEQRDGVDLQWHNGAISPLGFTSLVVRVPAKDRFVAYLANLDLPFVEPIEQKVIALAAK